MARSSTGFRQVAGDLLVPSRRPHSYDVFISYAYEADNHVAEALQHEMEQLLRPWYRSRSLRVFRDAYSLAASTDLWPEIVDALGRSRWLVLLASPESAGRKWVDDEVAWWLENKAAESILIGLTAGTLDWPRTGLVVTEGTPLPPALVAHARSKGDPPLYVDLRGLRELPEPGHSAEIRSMTAALVAKPHGRRNRDEIVALHIEEDRRRSQIVRGAIVALTALLALVLALAGYVAVQRSEQVTQQRAGLGRFLVPQAQALQDTDPRLALRLGEVAYELADDPYTGAALLRTLAASHYQGELVTDDPITAAAFDPVSGILVTGEESGRSIAWRIDPDGQVVGAGVPLPAQSGAVTSMAFSPRGSVVAISDGFQLTRFWRVDDLARPVQIGKPELVGVAAAEFSPDGRILATYRERARGIELIDVSDLDDPVDIGTFALGPRDEPRGVGDEVLDVAFSPAGRLLASSRSSGQGTEIELWDLTAPQSPVLVGRAEGGRRSPVAFSRDGTRLAVGNSEGGVTVFDLARGPALEVSTSSTQTYVNGPAHLQFDGDTHELISIGTGSEPDQVRRWMPLDGASIVLLEGVEFTSANRSEFLAINAAGQMLMAPREESRAATLWSVRDRGEIDRISPNSGDLDSAKATAWVPGTRLLLAVGGGRPTGVGSGRLARAELWDYALPGPPALLSQLDLAFGAEDVSSSLTVADDGSALLRLSGDENRILRLDLRDVRAMRVVEDRVLAVPGRIRTIAFSADGNIGAVAVKEEGTTAYVTLWDMRTFIPIGGPLDTGNTSIYALSFAPSGDTMAVSSSSGTSLGTTVSEVGLWDLRDLAAPRRAAAIGGFDGDVSEMVFAGQGTLVTATDRIDHDMQLWDVADLERPRAFTDPIDIGNGVSSLAVSHDNRLVALSNSSDDLYLWDVTDLAHPVMVSFIRTDGSVGARALAVSPDDRILAGAVSGDQGLGLRAWDLDDSRRLQLDTAAVACLVSAGGPTEDEWRRYLPDLPHEDLCTP